VLETGQVKQIRAWGQYQGVNALLFHRRNGTLKRLPQPPKHTARIGASEKRSHCIRPVRSASSHAMHGAVDYEGKKAVGPEQPARGAWVALSLLLAINMFNYVDRYVLAAVEPAVQKDFFKPDDPNAEFWMGTLATAFMVSYLVLAPLFGWLADRMSRWLLVGI